MGGIISSHASECRPPYMPVEPRSCLDLEITLILYVQPIHLTRFFSLTEITSQFIRSGARKLFPLYHFYGVLR
jgi:hypothetical protein